MTTDLRYPVGRFTRPTSFSDASRAEAITTIADTPANMRKAVNGLSGAQLDTPYRPEGWTVRQVVHHLADSHVNAYIRTRFGLTEEHPTVKPYDEKVWAELPDAKALPVEVSLSILDGIHTRWATLLRSLKPAQFSRTLLHPENGEMTIDGMTAMYAWHGKHHVGHVAELRKRNGW